MPLLAYLEAGEDFPPTSQALEDPNGLLAAGGSLDADTLMRAYRRGIFPWYEAPQPVLWWSPDPRSVLFPEELHVSRSLRRTLRRDRFTLSVDRAFPAVMRACAEPRAGQRGTWIDRQMRDAYGELYQRGHAHSIEVWLDDELVGGLYGVAVSPVFFGESMFSRVSDASKVALVGLVHVLQEQRIDLIDCQIESEHLNSLGARNIPRVDFEQRLEHTHSSAGERWRIPRQSSELLPPDE